MNETPATVHGRLLESVHMAGYAFERAWPYLEWLLEEHRWQQVGPGYTDINAFLATFTLPEGVTPERRKAVAARIKALQPEASQRKIAGVLGVDQATIHHDLKASDDSSSSQRENHKENKTHKTMSDEYSSTQVPAKTAHVAHNTGETEWYTPARYVELARTVLGDIDLDPASSLIAQRTVQAHTFYTADEDGLRQPWRGRVWLNPPYAAELIGQFTQKLCQHVRTGEVSAAMVLVNNATETTWFQELAQVCQAVCFPQGRVRFLDPAGRPGAPLQGQALLYSGPAVDQFLTVFRPFGGLWRRDATDTR